LKSFIFERLTQEMFENSEAGDLFITRYALLSFPIFFYFLFFEIFFNGQSIGKKIMKIRVVSIDGYTPTVTQYFSRWIFRITDTGIITVAYLYFPFNIMASSVFYGLLFILPNILAFILVLNSQKEQRIGDLMSGTVVIKLNPSTQISDTIFEEVAKDYVVRYPNVLKLSDRDVTIIKTALQNAQRSGRDHTLWHISEKLSSVLETGPINDPYLFLETVIRDYNYLSAN
jgi:uncharacterized RDD family membrane protein YckC